MAGMFDDLIPGTGGMAPKGSRPSTTGAGMFDDLIPDAGANALRAKPVREPNAPGEEPGYLSNLGRGIGERALDIAAGFNDTTLAAADALGFDTKSGFLGDVRRGSEAAKNADLGYREGTSWDDFKESPLTNFIPFALEQGIVSAPDMAFALGNLPGYIYSRTGELGDQRAENNGIENATVGDLVATLPAAAASAFLERLGVDKMLGLGEVATQGLKQVPKAAAKAAAAEGATEAGQELIEYTGTNAGTTKGFDPAEIGEQMAAAAIGGAGFGGVVRTGTATGEVLTRKKTGADDLLPEGAGRAEDVLDDVVPAPADRERLGSTRLTQEDRDSPIPNDLIDDGKILFEGGTPRTGLAQDATIDFGADFDREINDAATEADVDLIDMSDLEARIEDDIAEDALQSADTRPSFLDGMTTDEAAAYAAAPGVNRAVARRLGVKIDELDAKGDTERANKLRAKLGPILNSFGSGDGPSARTSATSAPMNQEPSATASRGGGLMPTGDGSRRAPVSITGPGDLDGISPRIAAPTDSQAKAGNYAKGHGRWKGLDVAIETPKGGKRTGTSRDGTSWEVTMPAHYGDFKGTKGADGDPVDVYVGDDPESDIVFIVDQKDAETGKFDEHKVFVGTRDEAEVAGIFENAFSDGRGGSRLQDITETTVEGLKDWLANGDTSKPFGRSQLKAPVLPKRPVTAMLRAAGGVEPTSTLAGELRAMGITAKTSPGLFKRGGMGAADNFVREEQPLFQAGPDDGNGYVPEGEILEALRRELAGDPLRTADEAERMQASQPRDRSEPALDLREASRRPRSRSDVDPAVEVYRLIDVYGYPDSPELRQIAEGFIARGLDPEDAIVAAAERMTEQLVQPIEGASINEEARIPFFADDPGFDAAPIGRDNGQAEADGEGVRADQPRNQEGSERGAAGTTSGPGDGSAVNGGERAGAGRTRGAQPAEPGAEGKPQLVIPGAERAPDRTMAQRAADAPLRPKSPQKNADDGLFGSSRDQLDLVDMAEMPATERVVELSIADIPDDIGEARRSVRAKAREEFANRTVETDDGDAVIINWQGIKHATERADRSALSAMLRMDRLLAASVRTATEPDRAGRNNIVAVHRYATTASLDGVPVDVVIFVREHLDGKRFYDHAVLEKENPSGKPGDAAASREQSNQPTEGPTENIEPTDEDAKSSDRFREAAAGWDEIDAASEPRLTEAEQEAVVEIVRRVSGLSEVEFHDAIRIPSTAKGFKAWGREGKEGEFIPIAGFYNSMKDVIAVAFNSGGDGRRLAFHESFHRLQTMFLTDQEKALLAAETEALRAVVAATDGRQDQAKRMSQIELEAEAFAIYSERMERGGAAPLRIKGRIRVAWDRLRAMSRRVRNYLNGRGYQTFEDVFDMARSGEVKDRAGKGAAKDVAPALSEMENSQFDVAPDLTNVEPQERVQGFLAKGQPIDRALRAPFDFLGLTNKDGEFKIGKAAFEKAGQIITEAKFSPDGRMAWMNGWMGMARAGLIDRYGLDPAYVERDRARALDERRVMMKGAEVLKSLADQDISVEEAKVLQAILTGEAVDDAAMNKLAEPIRMAIDELGHEAVQLGLLSAESYERNRGSYLHRVYLKNEADQSGLAKMASRMMGNSRKKILGDQFKGRGMFFEVPRETATKNLAEVVKQRREEALAKTLKEKLDRLETRRKVVAARLEESQSESAINLARRMDVADAAREQKGGARPYQKGQMREQGVAMGRLRKKAEQAQRVLAKIDAEAGAAKAKVDAIEANRLVVGKFMPIKGEKYAVLDKRVVVNGKEKVVDRVYIPTKQSVPAAYRDYVSQGTWEVRGAKGDKVVLWRDYTKAERGKMGEILDARYTIAKTYMLMSHDLATGRFYKDLAENPEWAAKEVDDGASWKNAAQVSRMKPDPELQWVKVPDDALPGTGGKKRWGALAGQFVRAEIWRDINEIETMNTPTTWRLLLSQWKLNKTARSPVTHMNNVMSNLIFMDMADVRFQDLAAAIRSYHKGDADFREAVEFGAFGMDMMSQEIRKNVLQPILDELTKTEQGGVENSFLARAGILGKLADQVWSSAKKFDDKMIDAYRIEDEVFRMATFLRRKSLGDSAEQAALVARETFMDYDIRAPWVNAARNSVLPFISYTYRAAPMIAKTMATRPWKLAKYWAIAYALNALAYAWDDDGDEEKERASLRDEEQGKTWIGVPRMLRMPFRNNDGLPVFLDVRRWLPAGIFSTPTKARPRSKFLRGFSSADR